MARSAATADAVDGLVRRVLHDGIGTAEFCAQLRTTSARGVGRLAAEFDIACEEYRAADAPVDTSRPANPGGARRSYGQADRPTAALTTPRH
jgi:hypothetical protein